MDVLSRRSTAILLILGLAAASGGRADAADPKVERADFSGTWALSEGLGERPVGDSRQEGLARGDGRRAGSRGGARGGGTGGEGVADLPWELVEDERRLVVEDDGTNVQITRAQGRRRVLYTDGEERELDDGDGPAKVTAKRKGGKGERIVVSMEWWSGRQRKETWELLSNPRRLAITTTVKDRRSVSFKRTYEPAPPQPAVATPKPPAAEIPAQPATATGLQATPPALPQPAATAPTPPGVLVHAARLECAIHPPRGASQAELTRLAKITQAEAAKRAMAFASPSKPSSVISSDVEVQDGCLVWSFLLRFQDRHGAQEIVIDAGDGKVLSSEDDGPK